MPAFLHPVIDKISAPLFWGLAATLALLLIGTVVAVVLPMLRPAKDWTNLRQRVASWWVMIALVAAALVAGWGALTILFAGVSFLALKEFLSLAPTQREDRLVILFAYLSVPIAYGLVAVNSYGVYLVAIPVWFFITTPFLMVLAGQTKGFLARVGMFNWGVVTCVYNLGVIALLMRVPPAEAPQAGPAGLVFFLLFATEANDVLQYVCGRLFGRRKILPSVSPNKTWGGFLGGWIGTGLLIFFLAPVFTPLPFWPSLLLAVLLPLGGFAGDVTMSAIKRDIGVKDTSRLIPGHGGVLDRVDSLTFTAPLYFHILAYYAHLTY
ncbi:MAG TPA: phosphatidate cytidylyltransferase [Caulobacteraceae bacterium]|jgi:phosphatidate cytidylyltransferase